MEIAMKLSGNVFYVSLISGILALTLLSGCGGLQVNIPVKVESVKREEAALLVLVENRSTHQIKITYPVSIGMLKQKQHTIFSLSKPCNHKVVITAYTEDRRYRDVYQPFSTIEDQCS